MEPYREQILNLLSKGFKPSQILHKLQEAYPDKEFKRSTLNEYCCNLREEYTGCRTMKSSVSTRFSGAGFHKVTRREIITSIWSGENRFSASDMTYITQNYPLYSELQATITDFRTAYTQKDADLLNIWIEKHAESPFQSIKSFIKGFVWITQHLSIL
jgi:hypothetical protein